MEACPVDAPRLFGCKGDPVRAVGLRFIPP